MIDLIRDGTDLARGDSSVRHALVRTAMSAWQRGWDRIEWEFLLDEPTSNLGRQARLRRGKPCAQTTVLKAYADAWDRAVAAVNASPTRSTGEMNADARRRAHALRDMAADPDADLTDSMRAVLAHAVVDADRRGVDRVALSRRALLDATGLGLTALRTALAHLNDRGLLTLAERGRPRGDAAKAPARANLYRLAAADDAALAPYLYPLRGSVVPPGQFCGAPPIETPGAPASSVVPPLTAHPDREVDVLTLTHTPDGTMVLRAPVDQATLDRLVGALRGYEPVEVRVEDAVPLLDNVLPLRGRPE